MLAHVIQQHRHELEYLADLIHWRLELREQKPTEWNADNPFYWLRGCSRDYARRSRSRPLKPATTMPASVCFEACTLT
jgi:hypothetical protein